ncbi:hypothetical protein C0995_014945 [Termitomyces sp. Mi166|nr:hypothetical protein C0995_014945 [Termitomyces sp. Mi166\
MPISTVKTSDIDVLVIGAGPAGLMACNALVRAGINVRIVDKRPAKVAAGHADGIQPRTIEVLQSYGLADRLLAEAAQLHQVAFYNPNPETGGIEGIIEDIFLDSMKKHGVEVSRPVFPVSMQISQNEKHSTDPDAYPVRVVLKDALEGQTEIVHAKYVIGGDGAHSWVRKTLNIDMEGEQTDYVWGVVDMVPDTDFPDIRNRCAVHSNHGSCMWIPREDDKVRLYIQLESQEAVDATSGRVDKDRMGPEKLLDVCPFLGITVDSRFDLDPRLPGNQWRLTLLGSRNRLSGGRYTELDNVWLLATPLTIASLLQAMHATRIHLKQLEDITHRARTGQGMNASMNDTHNLAWKLVHVIRGWAKPSLLKTYELERRKYAQDLIEFDKQFAKMFSGKIKTSGSHDGVSAAEFTSAFHKFGGFTSGVGICYQGSAIVHTHHQTVASGLVIGMRVPAQQLTRAADGRQFELQNLLPSDTRFKVLVFTGDVFDATQREKVNRLAADMEASDGFLRRYSPGGDIFAAFDIISIASDNNNTPYTDVPSLLRSHWSKLYVDKPTRPGSGSAYVRYGVKPTGAVVIIRPDGYVGAIAPFDRVADLKTYFEGIAR